MGIYKIQLCKVKVVSWKEKYHDTQKEEEVRTHTVGFFPGNLISNNHNQIKTFVKCPSCFFLKNGSTKEAKSNKHKGKKMFFE